MTKQTLNISDKLYQYILEHSFTDRKLINDLVSETHAQTDLPQMQIALEQGKFMGLLVKSLEAKCIIEIGTFTGLSTLMMATHLKDNGKIYALDISEEYTKIAQKYWSRADVESKIVLRLGEALTNLEILQKELPRESVDLVFIDADKENYLNYYQKVLPHIRKHGVILVDNTLWSGRVLDLEKDESTQAIDEFNKFILNDDRVSQVILPIGDGLTYIVKK